MNHDPVSKKRIALRPDCEPIDRRLAPRMRCTGRAKVTVLRLGKRLPGSLVDLSLSGCCIATEEPLPVTDSPRVEVQIAVEGTTLRLAGVVRNIRNGRRLGLEFIEVTPRKAEQIRLLVAELRERRPFGRDRGRPGRAEDQADPPANEA